MLPPPTASVVCVCIPAHAADTQRERDREDGHGVGCCRGRQAQEQYSRRTKNVVTSTRCQHGQVPGGGSLPTAGLDKGTTLTLAIPRRNETHEPTRATLSACGVCTS